MENNPNPNPPLTNEDPRVVWKRCIRAMYHGVDSLAKYPNVWNARKRGIASLDPETQQDGAILSDLANKSRYTGNVVGLDGDMSSIIRLAWRVLFNYVLTGCFAAVMYTRFRANGGRVTLASGVLSLAFGTIAWQMAAISAMVSRLPKAMEQLILREDSFQNTDKRDSSGSTMGNRGLGTILCSEVFSHLSPCLQDEGCRNYMKIEGKKWEKKQLIHWYDLCNRAGKLRNGVREGSGDWNVTSTDSGLNMDSGRLDDSSEWEYDMGYNGGEELPSADDFGLKNGSQSSFPEDNKWD